MLDQGKIVKIGVTNAIISEYMSKDRTLGSIDLINWQADRRRNGPMSILYLNTKNEYGQIQSQFTYGESITFNIGISGQPGVECIIGLSISDALGHLVLHFSNLDDKFELTLPSAETEIHMCPENNVLNEGTYYTTVFLGDGFNLMNDKVHNCLSFEVETATKGRVVCNSAVHLPAKWELRTVNSTDLAEMNNPN